MARCSNCGCELDPPYQRMFYHPREKYCIKALKEENEKLKKRIKKLEAKK